MNSSEDQPNNGPGGLNGEQWRELQECASLLEKELRAGSSQIDLRRYLPPPDAPHRRAVLLELIKSELEARYVRKQRCLLEEFLVRYPELGGAENLPASLVYEEYRVRRKFGDNPALDEYRSRFPAQFEGLRRLSEMDHSIGMGEGAAARSGTASGGAPPPLQQLGGYEKRELLGHGAFGEVWKAVAPGGVEVALKVVMRTLDHEATRRELKALEKIKLLRHPFLLQTHSFGMMDGKLTIVMELADGDLADRFKQCKERWTSADPGEELVTFFAQAAEALDYLQSQHVSHRDIKPQNLLILRGFAKVADFGFARGQGQGLEEASQVCGTPVYMAPEVWAQQVSRHSDQYSLAATYVHMRLGRPVFEGSFHEIFLHHINDEPQLDALPPAEQAVLKRALAKNPDQRFPSCAAFAQALKEATAPVKAPAPVRRSWKLGVTAAALAVTAALLVVVAVGKFMGPRPEPGPRVEWQPKGWEPEDEADVIRDRNDRRYYRRLARDVGGQRVVVVAVPRESPTDPATFYVMENKVWNDLYAVFVADEASKRLFEKYSSRPGCELLVSREPVWRRGAFVEDPNAEEPDPDKPPFFGVDGPKGRLPVFRVKVTEAHCFAEWLGGLLPTLKEWRTAAGAHDPSRVGPFAGPGQREGIAVGLKDGPWPVDRGDRDVSIHGCRQMAGNGKEWTRDLSGEVGTIPLDGMIGRPSAITVGRSYESMAPPLTFKELLSEPNQVDVTKADFATTFRIVLEEE